MKNEVIPNSYFITKGNSEPVQDGVISLDCYRYKIEKGENDWYSAKCDELNAYAQGKTWDELKSNILEVHTEMLDYV